MNSDGNTALKPSEVAATGAQVPGSETDAAPNSQAILRNGYTTLKQCRHGLFLFNQNDSFIGRSLDLYGEWCEAEVTALCQVLAPGQVVVDVGANVGTHTIPLANKVTSTGMVLAFEPQRQVFNYLTANIAINNLLHVATFQTALGNHPDTVHLPLFNPRDVTNFGAVNAEEFEEGEPVDMVELDSFNLERCHLIKIDVEGLEAKVLEGAQATIRRTRPILFVETTTVNHQEVISKLEDYKYTGWWHIARYYNPGNFFGNERNVFSDIHPESNLICFPNEANVHVDGLEAVEGPDDNWQRALERMKWRQRRRPR